MADATPAPTPTPSAPAAAKDWLAFVTYFIPIVLIYTMLKHGKEGNYLYHSKNAAGAIVVSIVLQVLYRVLWAVLDLGLVFMLLNLVNLALFIVMVYGGWEAANGKLPKLPVITQIGQKVPLEKWFNKSETAAATPAPAAAPSPAPVQPAPAAPVAPAAPSAPAAPTQNPPAAPQA